MTGWRGNARPASLKNFPVFSVFPVKSAFIGPGEGKGVVYREDREGGMGAWFGQPAGVKLDPQTRCRSRGGRYSVRG